MYCQAPSMKFETILSCEWVRGEGAQRRILGSTECRKEYKFETVCALER